MQGLVVDTHAIVWYLARDPRLSAPGRQILRQASEQGDPIFVPSICLVELTYLVEKGRLARLSHQLLLEALDNRSTSCLLAVLDRRVADAVNKIPRSEVPDMPDRIIAGTALALRLPLVSRDRKIAASRVETIW